MFLNKCRNCHAHKNSHKILCNLCTILFVHFFVLHLCATLMFVAFFNILFLFNFFQPETLKPKKTKRSLLWLLYMLSHLALLEYLNKDPCEKPCRNYHIEQFKFLCQRYIKSNWFKFLCQRYLKSN